MLSDRLLLRVLGLVELLVAFPEFVCFTRCHVTLVRLAFEAVSQLTDLSLKLPFLVLEILQVLLVLSQLCG